jgi:hypothetical protein
VWSGGTLTVDVDIWMEPTVSLSDATHTGERTAGGYFHTTPGIEAAINRGT